jgi:hypothetical protein
MIPWGLIGVQKPLIYNLYSLKKRLYGAQNGGTMTGQPIAKSKDLSERERFQDECGSSYVRWSTLPRHAFLFQTIRRWVRASFCNLIAQGQGGRQELRNFLHRLALRSAKRYPAMPLQVGVACHLDPTGVPVECIRTRDCVGDIKNFAVSHPKATVMDWDHFREGWEAGEKWGRSKRCSCTSASSTS